MYDREPVILCRSFQPHQTWQYLLHATGQLSASLMVLFKNIRANINLQQIPCNFFLDFPVVDLQSVHTAFSTISSH